MPINWNNFEFKEVFPVNDFKIKNLQDGIKISTICASCFLGTDLNLDNIFKYVSLNQADVLVVKKNNSNLRSIISLKQTKRRSKTEQEKKKTTSFQNSLTIVIRKFNHPVSEEELDNEGKVNLKLFNNGSIQMSGCKDLDGVNLVLNKLTAILKKGKTVMKDGKKTKINYVDDTSKVQVSGFKLDMINCNYKVKVTINREKLNNLLIKKKIKSSYEPCIRACVIIKYMPEQNNTTKKEISIFVFEQGNIIITGAKNQSQIEQGVSFINGILINHLEDVQKTLLNEVIRKSKFKNLLLEEQ